MAAEPLAPEATVELLSRAKNGDAGALERLLQRCLPPLDRWAASRLPVALRGTDQAAALVRRAVRATLDAVEPGDVLHQGALQAHCRQAIRQSLRRLERDRRSDAPTGDHEDGEASPLERAIGAENMRRYDDAVDRLAPWDQQAIIGRLELQYSYDELAVALGEPSAAAARDAVTRALRHLAWEMARA